MKPIRDFFTFASEAEIIGLWGLVMVVVALLALWAEKRRYKTSRFDNVGWVPWTPIFMFSAMVAVALIALAVKGIIAG